MCDVGLVWLDWGIVRYDKMKRLEGGPRSQKVQQGSVLWVVFQSEVLGAVEQQNL